MDVQLPDGTIIRDVPEGTTKADLAAKLQGNGMSIPSDWLPAKPPEQSAVQKFGGALNDVPRQLGLTARYALEGPAQAAQIVTEPIRYLVDKVTPDRNKTLSNLVTGETPPKSLPLSTIASNFADWMGLPKPQDSTERVVGDASRLLAGGGLTLGAARGAAMLPGVTGQVGMGMAANPAAQLSSAAGAGVAGGASREAGGSELQQAGAALMGGVAGGFAPSVAGAVGNVAQRLFTPSLTTQQLDQQISVMLNRSGVDYSQIPERVRQSLRADAASALNAGQDLNPAALARLADFRATGTTPTRGMLTLDPVQITKEQNLAKMAANSADSELHGLPRLQNQNNQQLIKFLNENGAAQGNPYQAGQSAIGTIQAKDDALKSGVSGLYTAARAMTGADIPLNRSAMVDSVFGALAKENKLAYLPESISNTLNTISQGVVKVNNQTHNVPFTANTLDNLLTDIATAQRSTQDGNVKAALTIARKALTDTPIQPVKNTFGGNQLVTEGGASFLRAQDAQAGDYMSALNQARQAAAQRFGWMESSRPVEAALGGAQPDNFVKQFVINGTTSDVKALTQEVGTDQLKNAVLAHLKDKALGGASDEVGKFSQSAFNRAMNALGKPKLEVLFSKEELSNIEALARASSYMQVQPVGSAVNNSNSGALLLGKGSDALHGLLGKIPGGQTFLSEPLRNIEISIGNSNAQNVKKAIIQNQQRQQAPLGGLLTPAIGYGGLLSAPMVNDR